MACGEARGLVAFPAGIRDGAGEEHPVTEDDLGVGWGPRVTTGHSLGGMKEREEKKIKKRVI